MEIKNAPTGKMVHPAIGILIVSQAGVRIMSARQLYQLDLHVLQTINAQVTCAMEKVDIRNAPTARMVPLVINILIVPPAGVATLSAKKL